MIGRGWSAPALYVTDVGAGVPVLMITGWTISSAIFDGLTARLTHHRLRVIAYDHRGTGRSAAWVGPVSVALLAADAVRVLDERGLKSAHVVGVSFGAAVALELAVGAPTRVRTLTLVGGAAHGRQAIPPAAGRALAALTVDSLRKGTLWPAAVLFSDDFRRRHPAQAAAATEPFLRHRASPTAAAWQAVAAARFDRRADLAKVAAPTLIVHGERDVMVPVDRARRLSAGIPHSELHIFAGAGHAVPFEEPDRFVATLTRWVTAPAGAGRRRRPTRQSTGEHS